jgi:dTDP-4-amino-4,6-dideoxygalactose transaminase
MGVRIRERYLGTFGDGGFYSFGRGKNLSLAGGGLLVTHDDSTAEKIRSILNEHTPHGTKPDGMWRLLFYNTATRPGVYNILSRLPGMGLGTSTFDPDFGTAVMPAAKIRLLARMCARVDILNARRRRIAETYEAMLNNIPGVSIPRSKIDGRMGSLRFPVMVDDPIRRARILDRAARDRLGLSAMYPTPLDAIPDLRGAAASGLSGAHRIANAIITLPTHRSIPAGADSDGVMKSIIGLFR